MHTFAKKFKKMGCKNMFIERKLTNSLLAGAAQAPVRAVVGPRQSGKSTLIKKLFPSYLYLDMQDADHYAFASTDPKGFLESYRAYPGVIIDEAQYTPQLFPQLKVEVDKNPRPGFYILSGSQHFLLHEKISESLAGRAYLYTLLPFSLAELKNAGLLSTEIHKQMMKGFYPKVYTPSINTADYYDHYIATYVERDVRTLKNIENMLTFRQFMRLCALRIGTTINYTDLATQCGISVATVKSWMTILEASFILFLLPPYHHNLGKRLTKSPKLYFYDTGLAIALIGLSEEELIKQRVLFGGLFENMLIIDLIKESNAKSGRRNFSFFRDSNQKEINLIIEQQGRTLPVEIKTTATVDKSFFDHGHWFLEQLKSDQKPALLYGGSQEQQRSNGLVIPWHNTASLIT